MQEAGFNDMYEVGLGGDLTAQAEAEEWLEAAKEGKKLTTSCCPAFVNLIKDSILSLQNIYQQLYPLCLHFQDFLSQKILIQ